MSKGLAIVFVEEMYETLEFHYPRLRLMEAGYRVEVVSPEKGKTYSSKGGGYPAKVFVCGFTLLGRLVNEFDLVCTKTS